MSDQSNTTPSGWRDSRLVQSDDQYPRTPADAHEWVARIIRLQRLKAQKASAIVIEFSKTAPVEDEDLLTADIILCGLELKPDERERLYVNGR